MAKDQVGIMVRAIGVAGSASEYWHEKSGPSAAERIIWCALVKAGALKGAPFRICRGWSVLAACLRVALSTAVESSLIYLLAQDQTEQGSSIEARPTDRQCNDVRSGEYHWYCIVLAIPRSSATPVFCVVPMSENSRPRAAAHARPDERESGGRT